jgi:hypothetical protein
VDLSSTWHGVQTELGLPAPAIAISGTDGLQLWFSLAEPIPAARAHAFLERLRARFLPDIEPGRLRLMPASDASVRGQDRHARPVPALQEQTGNWSAFVAADLAPVFGSTPWLDIPPSEEGQAALLRGLDVMTRPVFEAAWETLGPGTPPTPPTAAMASSNEEALTQAQPVASAAAGDPERFLRQVMNDDGVALALRIEAAKALLQHSNGDRPRRSD